MSNVYNVLFTEALLDAKQLPKNLERLAQALVKSGRMRIDAHEKINFVRHPSLGDDVFFSHREIFDPALAPRTAKISGNLDLLKKEISTNQPVPEALEIKLARLFVQSAHPDVIELLLLEGVEIFISYSHNIGDLLDFSNWQQQRDNNGMQSIGMAQSRIFVSCDGDPFDNSKENAEIAKNARSRFMVIAAQEIGHYSDLTRNPQGAPYGRFSLSNWSKASSIVADARKKDILWVKKVDEIFDYLQLDKTAHTEKSVSFFKQYRKFSLSYFTAILKSYFSQQKLQRLAKKFNVKIAHLHKPSDLQIILADMRFNLTPKAPAYERSNKTEQEAIMCIEALARVPQQVIKWGHETTKFMWPNLYRFYYNTVIPANSIALQNLKKKNTQ